MRAKGRGTKRADGRWATSVRLPDGRRVSVYGTSQTELMAKAQVLRQHVRDGDRLGEDRRTVAQYLADWLAARKPSVRPQSYDIYARVIRLHITPGIGGIRLTRLRAEAVQQLYAALLEQGLAPSYVKLVHVVLSDALDKARKWRVVRENVCELVQPPRVAGAQHATLTAAQVRALLAAAAGEPLEAVYVLAVHTGMRQGELLGLRWQDVDLERGRLTVRGSLSQRGVWGETKTAGSRHTLLLTREAREALYRRSIMQLEERGLAGAAWTDTGYVFTRALGEPVLARGLLSDFGHLLARAALPRMRFHDLRHTVATLLMERGVHPSLVAALLGHAGTSTTLSTYSHVTEGASTYAIEALERLLSITEG